MFESYRNTFSNCFWTTSLKCFFSTWVGVQEMSLKYRRKKLEYPARELTYCWWKKSCTIWHGSLSYYLQGFIHPRWCKVSSINRIPRWESWNIILQKCQTGGNMWSFPHPIRVVSSEPHLDSFLNDFLSPQVFHLQNCDITPQKNKSHASRKKTTRVCGPWPWKNALTVRLAFPDASPNGWAWHAPTQWRHTPPRQSRKKTTSRPPFGS